MTNDDRTPASSEPTSLMRTIEELSAQLERVPRDIEGWTRLMRMWMIADDKRNACNALRSSLQAFDDDDYARQRLRDLADELGVPPAWLASVPFEHWPPETKS